MQRGGNSISDAISPNRPTNYLSRPNYLSQYLKYSPSENQESRVVLEWYCSMDPLGQVTRGRELHRGCIFMYGTGLYKDEFDIPKMYSLVFWRLHEYVCPNPSGKTSTARIIASQVKLPLIYVSLESIVSKWFGESEKNLGQIFDIARSLGQLYEGCIIFVDEIDSLAGSR